MRQEIDITKAIAINEKFQVSRQFWSFLVSKGLLPSPKTFINTTPHMTFVHGEENCDFLRRRFELLKKEPLFEEMEYSDDYEKIRKWAPLLTLGRKQGDERIACTRVEQGTDVDYGTLTKHLARSFIKLGGSFQALSTVSFLMCL